MILSLYHTLSIDDPSLGPYEQREEALGSCPLPYNFANDKFSIEKLYNGMLTPEYGAKIGKY